jgi:hypothetical protein
MNRGLRVFSDMRLLSEVRVNMFTGHLNTLRIIRKFRCLDMISDRRRVM